MDKLKGKGKEAVGKLTGDHRKESEGKADQTKATAKDKVDEAGDRAKGVTDSLRNDNDK
ncbi:MULTISPECIES: CsbD family protein [unclassified Streptomyces]|uniref:CsbD family protein n=1 Tax=unclassified Streptomyces TaxID=2593676 RepID=UPI0033B1283A